MKKLSFPSVLGASTLKKVSKIATVLPSILLILSCSASSGRAERKNIIFTGDFESRNFAGWHTHEGCCKYSHTITSFPTRSGNLAYRSLLKPQDKARAEIQLDPFPKDSERWVGVSIYVPKEVNEDASIFQFHIKPDKGQRWTPPPFQMSMNNNQITIKKSGKGTADGKYQRWVLGPVTRGQWMDFVFRIKSSHRSTGLFEAWMNGVKKVNYQGATALNRSRGPFVKMGVYVGIGNRVKKDTALYYDEFRVGNENARYEDVAPSRN
jgi:hypothetical protein